MASSTAESWDQDSNTAWNIDTGISVDFLLFGGNLVEKAFEEAMDEVAVHARNDNEVP